ncbi:hypothetical protein FEP48_00175 [Burkholderia multivorans]|nr:hypothetical protein [Burkholderia multivorans]MDR9062929.1 hypothetical protein [Burkholderia multivorans]MDR9072737.1 hypothetical protein [Burkholderia multivorans]MDR9093716.1 hypothetical protein [Burkholderia multivorans]MDR9115794.1 hypothetical protein [Burkholderia multivorans]
MTGAGFISLVGGISRTRTPHPAPRTPHPAPRTAFTQSP